MMVPEHKNYPSSEARARSTVSGTTTSNKMLSRNSNASGAATPNETQRKAIPSGAATPNETQRKAIPSGAATPNETQRKAIPSGAATPNEMMQIKSVPKDAATANDPQRKPTASGASTPNSQRCSEEDCISQEEVTLKEEWVEAEDVKRDSSASNYSEHTSKSRPRSDSSDNNSCTCEMALPCCRKRRCLCYTECSQEGERMCYGPCCRMCAVSPCTENQRLREENKELRKCIKMVRANAMCEACQMIKEVMGGCTCSCCKARKKLRPCKSVTSAPCRETWLCVPLPGSKCGGYTPSGWNKLLKKCRDASEDPCVGCSIVGQPSPSVNLRYKCLPVPPCPPCPHLCPSKSLPLELRTIAPCCPLYFPLNCCLPQCPQKESACDSCQVLKSASCKSCSSGQSCSKSANMTPPPCKPAYTPKTSASPGLPGACTTSDPSYH